MYGDMKNNLVAFSPQANYTERLTDRDLSANCQLLRIEGVARGAQRIFTALTLVF
jgi:hypothetical protein